MRARYSAANSYSATFGDTTTTLSNVVEVYVRYLRHKIGPERIVTVRGTRYRLIKESADADN